MHNRGPQLRLITKLNRMGVDYEILDPSEIFINEGPDSYDLRGLYISFRGGDRLEFFYSGGVRLDDWLVKYDLERDEDKAFGRHLRMAMRWLGY